MSGFTGNQTNQTQSQVYVFNIIADNLKVFINNYPVVLLRGYNTEQDFKYRPYGQAVPHVKEDLSGGFTDQVNNLYTLTQEGTKTRYNAFTLPDPSVVNNLILYISFNDLVIMNTDGFVLQMVTKAS